MSNHNIISMDEAKFLKTSKKLKNNLEIECELKANLSQIQEALATSLGYRNLHQLKTFFAEEAVAPKISIENNSVKKTIFTNMDSEQAFNVISTFIPLNNNDTWQVRANILLSCVLDFLVYMRDQKELEINADNIREYLILDNIKKIYKTRRDFPNHIRSSLRAYLISIPGFQEGAPKQNDTVIEQHGFLQSQFTGALKILKKIEKNDFLIADKRWFVCTTELKDGLEDNRDISEYINLYNIKLSLNPTLESFDFIEDSWLLMPEFTKWINYLYKKGNLKNIRVTDLLIYMNTIVSPRRYEEMNTLLKSILEKYSTCSKMSEEFSNTISNNKIDNILFESKPDEILPKLLNLFDKRNNEMWSSRLKQALTTVINIILFLQKQSYFIIDADLIKEFLTLNGLLFTYKERKDLPQSVINPLKEYLSSLPGINFDIDSKNQNNTVIEQHQYTQKLLINFLSDK